MMESPDTLKNVALVSRDLHVQVKRWMYRCLIIEDKPSHVRQVPLLLARMNADNEITTYIRHLHIRGQFPRGNPLRQKDRNPQLLQLLDKIPNLHSFW